ncbi:hypothetical protein A2U01_0108387, partial [Trifolium medium]|nr:hypothetical protein [Trifolium medium]
ATEDQSGTGQHPCAPRRLPCASRRSQERTGTTVQNWRAAQHEPARSAATCNTRRNTIFQTKVLI